MTRSLRSTALACVVALGCASDQDEKLPPATMIDECQGLAPITLTAHPTTVRIHEAVTLSATGGTGRYTFTLASGGSGGMLHADRFVAGAMPAMDHVTASDDCANMASVDIAVSADFDVEPAHATVKPGTHFQLQVSGTLGAVTYSAENMASGGTITPDGAYTAGPQEGIDLIAVRDSGSGDELLAQYTVRNDAQFRGASSVLALPTGTSMQLATLDGSGVSTWTKRSGPGTLDGSQLSLARDDSGSAIFDAVDKYTGETTSVTVHVLEELAHDGRPHGRLSDVANIVTGDFDGDGVQDVALGVPESDLGRPQGGALFVFRGSADGLPSVPTWTVTGDSDTANLGAVLAAGDLDGDGHDDLAASAPGADVTMTDSGAVLLYKFGADGPLLLRPALTGLGRGNFGASLAIADLDGDGTRDLVVGSPGADLAPSSSLANRGVLDLFMLKAGGSIPDLGTVRLGGSDLAADGTLKATRDLRFGRAVAVADFNGDGATDIASLGAVNNTLLAGAPTAKNQIAVAVHLGRASAPRYLDTPDLYVLPANLADGSEGTWRIAAAPPLANSKASILLLAADQMDSPDLSASGGVKSGSNAGGVLLYDLSAQLPGATAPMQPVQLGRSDAFAKLYGNESGIQAARSAAAIDVDGDGKLELVLGAPYASYNPMPKDGTQNIRQSGKLLVYPYATLKAHDELNMPSDFRAGATKSDTLGVALAGVASARDKGSFDVVAYAARASTQFGDFTGRLDSFAGKGALSSFSVTSTALPARLASQQHGVAIELAAIDGKVRAAVGMPGFSGPGNNADGNDVAAGRALAYALGDGVHPQVVAEGAGTAYSDAGQAAYGGRSLGSDVAWTDFDGDGSFDLVVAAPQMATPAMSSTDYASLDATCVAQSSGGARVFLSRADGSFAEGFRIFAVNQIADCMPVDDPTCKRSGLARAGLAGGFDFDGDGKQDLAITRNNGIEVYLGRTPDDASLGKPSILCTSAFTLPALATQTSALVALGDLDADGCSELGMRYSDNTHSGFLLAFGYASDTSRCAAHHAASWLRISGDTETGFNNMQLGVAATRAGKLLGDARDFVAVSAGLYPFAGLTQPAVLLFDAAQLIKLRPAKGELLLGALGMDLMPLSLTYSQRTVGFGRALAGDVDLDGDGQPDLVVSAPGASINGDGVGAVFGFRGGASLGAAFSSASAVPLSAWLTVVGDGNERASVGQSLSVVAKTGSTPTTVGIGAPLSYRTGTANGTSWLLPL